jgi:hypothetical protein
MGALTINVNTFGADIDFDADGYSLVVDNDTARRLPVSASVTSLEISAGGHRIRLGDVAENCSTEPINDRAVNIVGGGSVTIAFDVRCAPNTGILRILTSTLGANANSYSFTADVSGLGTIPLTANGIAEFKDVRTGDLTIALRDMPPSCSVTDTTPRTAQVRFASVTDVSFKIHCASYQDGVLMAYVVGFNDDSDIYVSYADAIAAKRLTTQAGPDTDPAWSPDGQKIAFATRRDGNFEIYVMSADGTNQVRLTNGSGQNRHPTWSADGRRIAFASDYRIEVMNGDGTNRSFLVNGNKPDWSPDGNRIAFSNSVGIASISVSGSDMKQVTNSGDDSPAWSPDGRQIAFTRSDWYGYTTSLLTANSDGSGVHVLTDQFADVDHPTWVDNNTIAFSAIVTCWQTGPGCDSRIVTVDTFGTMLDIPTARPAFSPAMRR